MKIRIGTILLSILITSLVFCQSLFSQQPNWHWSINSVGNSAFSGEDGANLILDKYGNIYSVGNIFSSRVTIGSYTHNTFGGTDFFVNKCDNNGNILWQNFYGGNGIDLVHSIGIDLFGEIVITGEFRSSSLIIGIDTLLNTGLSDVFIIKLDSSGNEIWVNQLDGDSAGSFASEIVTDQHANVYCSGKYASPVLKNGSDSISNKGCYDIHFSKYDKNGDLKWIKQIGGSSCDLTYTIISDKNGHIYVSGYGNSDSLFIDSTILLNPSGNTNSFLLKFDTMGTLVWSKMFLSATIWIHDMEVDKNKNLLLTGNFQGSELVFGQDTLVNSNIRRTEMFVAKFDSIGNEVWAISAEGQGDEKGFSILSFENHIYVMGNYSVGLGSTDTISFNSISLPTPAGAKYPSFIVKYSSIGIPICAFALPTCGQANQNIRIDTLGNLYVCGDYTVDPFILDSTTLNLSTQKDYFLAKFDFPCPEPIGIKEIEITELKNYPNPFNDYTKFYSSVLLENVSLLLYNSQGEIVKQRNNITGNSFELHKGNLPQGIYIFHLRTDTELLYKGKLIVVD